MVLKPINIAGYKCKICGEEFTSRKEAREHVKEKHRKLYKDSNKFRVRGTKRNGLMEFIEVFKE